MQVVSDQRVYHIVNAISSNPDIWELYFTDFITHKLNLVRPDLSPDQGNLVQQFWDSAYIILQGCALPQRLAELHCCARKADVTLAQTATILYPMTNIQKVRAYCISRYIECAATLF